jgi:two-component system cell cycle response regulator
MQNARTMLERVANLTRLHSLEELENNLLQAAREFFQPNDVFLLTIDRGGDAHMLRRSSSDAPSKGEHTNPTLLRNAAATLQAAHGDRQLAQQWFDDTGLIVAYPLIDSPPMRTGLVMIMDDANAAAEASASHRVLDIFRNLGEVLDNAQRDELTGLLNRKTFDDNMQRVIARSIAYSKRERQEERRSDAFLESATQPPVHHHIAMVDIDHFKSINDQFGHLVGDEVILAVANQLRECIRDTDLIYRFGGEEFVIILTGVDRSGASSALERLRKTMAEAHFPRADRVTISYGMAEVQPGVQAHQLLDRADSALYYAKQHGRNQGHYYEALVDTGRLTPLDDQIGEVELF